MKGAKIQLYEVSDLVYSEKNQAWKEVNKRYHNGRVKLCKAEKIKYHGTIDYQFNRKKNLQCDVEKDGKLLRIRKILNGI